MSESLEQPFGRYVLEQRFARGGMAEVFLARQEGPGGFARRLVIKRILPELAHNARFVEMFLDEARLAARLSHPNIVAINDFGQEGDAYFLALELVSGPSVRDLGHAVRKAQIALRFDVIAKLGAAVAEGLAYAHAACDDDGQTLHIVHRDISPSNIVISADGVPKILDFGIAKAASSTHRTQTGELKGKIAYMPPEQVLGEPLDGRCDVYSLGVVLYQLVAGRRPFAEASDFALMSSIVDGKPTPPSQHNAAVPPELERIILRALAAELDDRYADARKLNADLERFVLSCGGPVSSFDIAEQIRHVEEAYGHPLNELSALTGRSQSFRSAASKAAADLTPEQATLSASVSRTAAAERPLNGQQDDDTVKDTLAPTQPMPGERAPTVPLRPAATGSEAKTDANWSRSSTLQVQREVPERTAPRPWLSLSRVALLGLLGVVAGIALILWQSESFQQVDNTEYLVMAADPAGTEAEVPVLVAPATAPAVDGSVATPEPGSAPSDAALVDAAARTVASKPRPGKRAPRNSKTGHVNLQTTPWTEVYLDGKKLGDTPLRVELPRGKHKLVLKNLEQQIHKELPVRVRAGAEVQHRLVLTPGTVSFLVKPWGKVYVDGQLKGVTPMEPVRLSPGRHTVDVVHPDSGRRAQRSVEVKAGTAQVLKIDLSEGT